MLFTSYSDDSGAISKQYTATESDVTSIVVLLYSLSCCMWALLCSALYTVEQHDISSWDVLGVGVDVFGVRGVRSWEGVVVQRRWEDVVIQHRWEGVVIRGRGTRRWEGVVFLCRGARRWDQEDVVIQRRWEGVVIQCRGMRRWEGVVIQRRGVRRCVLIGWHI